MFFSGKLNLQVQDLQLEVTQLKTDNQRLIDENQSLTQRIYEQNTVPVDESLQGQQEVCSTWVRGGALIGNVRETLAHAAASLESEKQSLSDSMGVFSETGQAVEVILDRVLAIQGSAQAGNSNVQSLLVVSDQIKKFVGVIRDISDQTNLLALNAAIEAARAGESGRGFAVVADEVRNLARKASEASNEIANLVGKISSQTIVASEDIGQVDVLSSEVVASAEQIKAGVSQVVELSERMNEVITGSAADAFIQTVKLDHVKWKNTVYEAIVTSNFNDVNSLADHTSCRLGEWYFMGDGRRKYSGLPSFNMLSDPHERVHASGLAAIQAAQGGNVHLAAQYLGSMEKASMDVANALDRLNDEIR